MKILLLYVSRSFSTLFMRIMMNAGARAYHDRLGGAIRFPSEDFTPRTVTDFYIAEGLSNAARNQHTFVKESCWVFEQHEEHLHRLIREHGFTPVYLVRNPKDALNSYVRMERRAGDTDKWSAARSIRHDLLYHFYKKYGGLPVIGEELVSAPAKVMREVFEHLSLPFDEAILELRPMNVDEMDESRILKHYRQFYEGALSSDKIIDKTALREEVELEDAGLREIVERNGPYYQLFLEEKRRGKPTRAPGAAT